MSYQISQWTWMEVDSYAEGMAQDDPNYDLDDHDWYVTDEFQAAQDKFTKEANRVVEKWMRAHPEQARTLKESDSVESEDDIAWNTWSAFVGHGVGFWEHMSRADYDSLKAAINKDKKLEKARRNLDDYMMMAAEEGFPLIEENPSEAASAGLGGLAGGILLGPLGAAAGAYGALKLKDKKRGRKAAKTKRKRKKNPSKKSSARVISRYLKGL